jgi:predicted transcriptional regulator
MAEREVMLELAAEIISAHVSNNVGSATKANPAGV